MRHGAGNPPYLRVLHLFEEKTNIAYCGEEFGFGVAARDLDIGFQKPARMVGFSTPTVGHIQNAGLPGHKHERLPGFFSIRQSLHLHGFNCAAGMGFGKIVLEVLFFGLFEVIHMPFDGFANVFANHYAPL